MLQNQEFDRLDEALKVVLEQGAKRVSYAVQGCIHPESDVHFTKRSYCFEKGCQVPISDELKRLGHSGIVPVTCSISKIDGESKWQLSQWIKGTGGSIEIDPTRPGIALGAAFVEHDLQEIGWKKRSLFSSLQEQQLATDYMSVDLLSQWNKGYFERMFLNKSTINLTPFIKTQTHPHKWEWLDRPTIDPYLTSLGFIITATKVGEHFKCKKGQWSVWWCNKGWQIAYLDPKTNHFDKPVRYGQGLKDGLEVALNIVERLQPENFPSHEQLETAYQTDRAAFLVNRINHREILFDGIRYFCGYSSERSAKGGVIGWIVYDAKPFRSNHE